MKKLSTIIFLAAVILVALYAAPAGAGNNSLYLLQGSPTPDVSASYSVNLHRWHEGSGLEKVRKVAEADTGIEFIKIYYDQRVIVIRGNDYSRRPVRNVFSILSMDRPLEKKSFKVEYPGGTANGGKHLFDIPGKGMYEEVDLLNVDTLERSFGGVNIETLQREELSRDVYKHLVLYGEAGVGMPGWDVIRAGMNENRNIEISLPYKIVTTEWETPKDLNYNKDEYLVIYVNNNNVLAFFPSKTRESNPNSLGQEKIYVLNKKTGKWDSFHVKGNNTMARGFKKWIGGYVRVSGFKPSKPEKKERPSKSKRKGIPSEARLNAHGNYAPGILFIYNPDTRKKYEIETGDADSEVLLVEGDYVYYRVYDEIYKSKIGKDKLEEPVLLVKDDVVPDIHWAFFGPKVDVQTEVQTR